MNAGRNTVSGAPLREIVSEAFINLRSQGKRSLLALLGILIGTASIIAMLNIGHLAQRETMKSFEAMGVDMMRVSAAPKGQDFAGFDKDYIASLPEHDRDIVQAVPVGVGAVRVFAGISRADLSLVAMTQDLARLSPLDLASGRPLMPIDDNHLVALLGHRAAADLSAPGAQILPGAQIQIDSYNFTVVGILAPSRHNSLLPTIYDNTVFIPLEGSRRIRASSAPNMVMIRLKPDADVAQATERLKSTLQTDQSVIQILSAIDMIKAMNNQNLIFTGLLAAIGGISLLVGGIGVMNVMLMSVMERRREIGLRAAVGATPRDIQVMFLVEAAALSVTGGLFGLVLGVLISLVVALLFRWDMSLALYVLPLGPGVAGLVGIIFGFQPALQASRLDPIEALRAE